MTYKMHQRVQFWPAASAAVFGVKLADAISPPHNPIALAVFWGIVAVTLFILSLKSPTHDARREERG